MLDVLGFDSKISSSAANLLNIMQEYVPLTRDAKTAALSPRPVEGSPSTPPPNFEIAEFVFDTLVLVSKPISPKSVGDFILSTCELMEKFFAHQYPLRGAISLGSVAVDQEPHIFLSDAFKRLSRYGDAQNWAGCVILPEAEDLVVENLLGDLDCHVARQSSAICKISPPWKIEKVPQDFLDRSFWCLNWSYFLQKEIVQEGLNFLKGDREKFEGTRRYLDQQLTLPDDLQLLPDDFAPAKTFKCMKARSSARMAFSDADGNPAQPNGEFSVSFY
ncbi:MAG: hypothetical protein Q8S60_15530 [Parvibaculum sp.]|nr:hypothetical protein [Parvibaculum sp.]